MSFFRLAVALLVQVWPDGNRPGGADVEMLLDVAPDEPLLLRDALRPAALAALLQGQPQLEKTDHVCSLFDRALQPWLEPGPE